MASLVLACAVESIKEHQVFNTGNYELIFSVMFVFYKCHNSCIWIPQTGFHSSAQYAADTITS